MKYYGNKTNDNDLVDKKYVDSQISENSANNGKLKLAINENASIEVFSANTSTDSTITLKSGNGISLSQNNSEITITNTNSGSNTPGNGILQLQVNSSDSNSNLFTANQSTNSTLNLIGTNGVTITKTESSKGNGIDITITGSGGGSSNDSYYKYSMNTLLATPLTIPTSYKNVVVKFYYNNISTPGSGGRAYILRFDNKLNEGSEIYIYLRNIGDTAGVDIQVPTSFTFSDSSSDSTQTYPVIYNGYYSNDSSYNNETISLQYSGSARTIIYTGLVLHVFFDGEVYFINKLQYTLPSV